MVYLMLVSANCASSNPGEESKGAFLLSELAGQTRQFAKKMQQFEEDLHENLSHPSGGVYATFELCYYEGVVKLVLPNTLSGRSVLSNGKRPKAL